MSRGLGKVERKVLRWLAMYYTDCGGCSEVCEEFAFHGDIQCGCREPRDPDARFGAEVEFICQFVAGNVRCPVEIEEINLGSYSDSVYKSTLRALQSLERKGWISKEKHTSCPLTEGCGGRTWSLTIKPVSVDATERFLWTQHLAQ